MNIHPQELSADAFANKVDFPTEYPLPFGQIQHGQAGDKEIQKLLVCGVRDLERFITTKELSYLLFQKSMAMVGSSFGASLHQ
jgi:hypothetical protein